MSAGESDSKQSRDVGEPTPHSRLDALQWWQLGRDSNNYVSSLELLVESVQLFSLAAGPLFLFEHEVVYEVVFAFFSLHIPLWYQSLVTIPLEYYYVPFMTGLALVSLIGAILLVDLTASLQRIPWLWMLAKWLAYLFGGVLFFPLTGLFLGPVFCTSTGHVSMFPSSECYSPPHIGFIILAPFGVLMVAAFRLLIYIVARKTGCQPQDVYATPHLFVECADFAMRLFVEVFFFILMPAHRAAFCILLVIAVLLCFVYTAFALPFYSTRMNQARCAVLLATAFAGAVSAQTFLWEHERLRKRSTNSLLLAAGAPLAAALGALLATCRVSPEYQQRNDDLFEYGIVVQHEARFPYASNETLNDLQAAPPQYRSMERDLLGEYQDAIETHAPHSEEAAEVQLSADCEATVPFISHVLCPTDAELACRFVENNSVITKLRPTGNVVAFATRIYLKAMVMFHESPTVKFHFALFLFAFARKLHTALCILDEIDAQSNELDILTLYQSHAFSRMLRSFCGIRDYKQQQVASQARRHHKETLSDIHHFWTHLTLGKEDIVDMAYLSAQITARRRSAEVEYIRICSETLGADHDLLLSYANFLEHVKVNPSAADDVRQFADMEVERRKSFILRGRRTKAVAVPVSLLAPQSANDNVAHSQDGTLFLVRPLVLLVGVLAVVLLAIDVAHVVVEVRDMHAMHSTGVAGAQLLGGLSLAYDVDPSDCSSTSCTNAITKLSSLQRGLVTHHNQITFGNYGYSSSHAATRDYFTIPKLPLVREGAEAIPKVWDVSALTDDENYSRSIEASNGWFMPHAVAAALGYLINVAMQEGSVASLTTFLSENSWAYFRPAVNETASLREDSLRADANSFYIAKIATIAVGLCLSCWIAVSFFATLSEVAAARATMLGFFNMIPFPIVESLQSIYRARTEQFDDNEKKLDADLATSTVNNQQPPAAAAAATATTTAAVPNAPVDVKVEEHVKEASGHSFLRGRDRPSSMLEDGKKLSRLEEDRAVSRFFAHRRVELKSCLRPNMTDDERLELKKQNNKHATFKQGILNEAAPHKKLKKDADLRIKPEEQEGIVSDFKKTFFEANVAEEREEQEAKKKRDQAMEKIIRVSSRTGVERIMYEEAQRFKFQIMAVGIAVCLAVAVGCLIGSQYVISDLESGLRDIDSSRERLSAFRHDLNLFMVHGEFYTHFGEQEHYAAVSDMCTSELLEESARVMAQSAASEGTCRSASVVSSAFQRIRTLYLVAMKMSTGYFCPAPSLVPLLHAFHYEVENVTGAYVLHYKDSPRKTLPLLVPWSEIVSNITKESTVLFPNGTKIFDVGTAKLKWLARGLDVINALKIAIDEQLIDDSVTEASTTLFTQEERLFDSYQNGVPMYVAIAECCLVVAVAFLCVMLRSTFVAAREDANAPTATRALLGSVAMRVALSLILAGTIISACLALTVLIQTTGGSFSRDLTKHRNVLSDIVNTATLIVENNRVAARYASVGRARYPYEFYSQRETIRASVARVGQFLTEMALVPGSDWSSFETFMVDLLAVEDVTMYIKRRLLSNATPTSPFVSQYDIATESDYGNSYADDHPELHYTTSERDFAAHSPSVMQDISRFALRGQRGFSKLANVVMRLDDYRKKAIVHVKAHDAKTLNSFKKFAISSWALSLVSGVLAVAVALAPIAVSLFWAWSLRETVMLVSSLFAPVWRKWCIALSLIVFLFVAHVGFSVATHDVARECVAAIRIAHQRSADTALSFGIAKNALKAIKERDLNAAAVQLWRLKRAADDTTRAAAALEAASEAQGFGHCNLMSDEQKAALLGGSGSLRKQLTTWVEVLNEIASTKITINCPSDTEVAVACPLEIRDEVLIQMTASVSKLEKGFDDLQFALNASNAIYRNDAITSVRQAKIPTLTIAAALLVLILVDLKFVFSTLTDELAEEENSTRLLLRMVPPNIRALIPMIQCFLETGQTAGETPCAIKSATVGTFITEWQKGTPTPFCFAILEECSHAFVLADSSGLIRFANQKLASMMNYEKEDLVEKNVSILMEEPLQSLHDNFLRRYIAGNPRSVGAVRDVYAVSRTGQRNRVWIRVFEAPDPEGRMSFLAQVDKHADTQ